MRASVSNQINNIDLTQHFSLSILTDFRYQSIKITWLPSIFIDTDFCRLTTPGNSFQSCASTSAAVLELANSVMPRVRPSNSTSTPNKETWRIPFFLPFCASCELFWSYVLPATAGVSCCLYYSVSVGRHSNLSVFRSCLFVVGVRIYSYFHGKACFDVHSLSRYFFTRVTARAGGL